MGVLSILSSSVFGSVLGSVFAWLNKREERAEAKARQEHEQKMLALQNEQAIRLADKGMQATQVVGQVAVAGKEADAFVESQKSAFQATTSHVVEIARGLMRPLITVYMLGVATYFAINVSLIVGGLPTLDSPTLVALYSGIIEECFFLANLCVSWWFGARGSSRGMIGVRK